MNQQTGTLQWWYVYYLRCPLKNIYIRKITSIIILSFWPHSNGRFTSMDFFFPPQLRGISPHQVERGLKSLTQSAVFVCQTFPPRTPPRRVEIPLCGPYDWFDIKLQPLNCTAFQTCSKRSYPAEPTVSPLFSTSADIMLYNGMDIYYQPKERFGVRGIKGHVEQTLKTVDNCPYS